MGIPVLRTRLGCYPHQVAVFRMPFMHGANFSSTAAFCDALDNAWLESVDHYGKVNKNLYLNRFRRTAASVVGSVGIPSSVPCPVFAELNVLIHFHI